MFAHFLTRVWCTGSGRLYVAGAGDSGQLGLGHHGREEVFVPVPLPQSLHVRAVACSGGGTSGHTLAAVGEVCCFTVYLCGTHLAPLSFSFSSFLSLPLSFQLTSTSHHQPSFSSLLCFLPVCRTLATDLNDTYVPPPVIEGQHENSAAIQQRKSTTVTTETSEASSEIEEEKISLEEDSTTKIENETFPSDWESKEATVDKLFQKSRRVINTAVNIKRNVEATMDEKVSRIQLVETFLKEQMY